MQVSREEFEEQENLLSVVWDYGGGLHDICRMIEDVGTRRYWRTFLRVAGRTFARRAKKLDQIVDRIFDEIGHSQSPIREECREKLHRDYNGEAEYEYVYLWLYDELKREDERPETKQPDHDAVLERNQREAFTHFYRETRRAAYAGTWSVLSQCLDLGAAELDADELVTDLYTKIWASFAEWQTPGTATMTTRVYEYARLQALGWRKSRISQRARRVDPETLEYKGARSGRKPSLSHYDNRSTA
jgi:hypothetical protein